MQRQSKPTFEQIYKLNGLTIEGLAGSNPMYLASIKKMAKGEPVLRGYALRVLGILSEHTGHCYSLETVDVNIMNIRAEV